MYSVTVIAKCFVQSICSNVAPWENMLFLLAYAKIKMQSNRTVDLHLWFLHIDSTILQLFKPSNIYGWQIGLMCQTLKTSFLTTRLKFYLINNTKCMYPHLYDGSVKCNKAKPSTSPMFVSKVKNLCYPLTHVVYYFPLASKYRACSNLKNLWKWTLLTPLHSDQHNSNHAT